MYVPYLLQTSVSELQVDDHVYAKTHFLSDVLTNFYAELAPRWAASFKVTKKHGDVLYIVNHPSIDCIKLYISELRHAPVSGKAIQGKLTRCQYVYIYMTYYIIYYNKNI